MISPPPGWTTFPLLPHTQGVCACGTSCRDAGKHPAVRWSHLQPGEQVPIPPGYGCGLATGERSDVVVIDLDVKDGRDGIGEFARLGSVPPTLVAATPSGGLHVYFQHPGVRVPNSASKLAPGVDVRGDGGYVVLPPSLHRNGRPYAWLTTTDLAPLPPWLLARLVDPGLVVTRDALAAFAARLLRSHDETKRANGEALRLVVRGEPFAAVGSRDDALFRLAGALARQFHDHSPAALAVHFGASLGLMPGAAPGDLLTVDDVAEKIERARAYQTRAQADQRTRRLSEAWRGARVEPYTPDELEPFGDLQHRWIVQRGPAYYVWLAGSYEGPYTAADVGTAVLRDLAPAPIALYMQTAAGAQVPKPIAMLVHEYGTVAQSTVLDMRLDRAWYHSESRTLYEAPCPLRRLDPLFDPQVDQWLKLFAGTKYELLCRWLSACPDVREPLVALFLFGPGDTGKSLLASGVARLWTTDRPTALAQALAQFNDALARCPLAFADEELPKDHRGLTRNAELREFIQARTRPLRRKYQPDATLLGCARVLVAANNEDILATAENLNANDVNAIADRYLPIHVSELAIRYLKLCPVDSWVAQDLIARHVLWLAQNFTWTREGRFQIVNPDRSLLSSLVTRSGVRSAVCQWLVGYLTDPARFHHDTRSAMAVRVQAGALLANASGLLACWSTYVQNETCPTLAKLANALATLGKLKHRLGDTNYRVIDPYHLIAWSEGVGGPDGDQIAAALSRETNSTNLRLVP